MNEPIDGHEPDGGPSRKPIASLLFGAVIFAASSANAGAIRHHHVVHEASQARLQATAVDPWGAYWQSALQHHWMHVKGPKALSILSLSADGTLPVSPFVEYLQWRQGLHAKNFNSFHPDIARVLTRVARAPTLMNPTPSPTPIVPGGPVPIQPPDFIPETPTTSLQLLGPPQVPEPASGVIALAMIGVAIVARRKIGDRA